MIDIVKVRRKLGWTAAQMAEMLRVNGGMILLAEASGEWVSSESSHALIEAFSAAAEAHPDSGKLAMQIHAEEGWLGAAAYLLSVARGDAEKARRDKRRAAMGCDDCSGNGMVFITGRCPECHERTQPNPFAAPVHGDKGGPNEAQ